MNGLLIQTCRILYVHCGESVKVEVLIHFVVKYIVVFTMSTIAIDLQRFECLDICCKLVCECHLAMEFHEVEARLHHPLDTTGQYSLSVPTNYRRVQRENFDWDEAQQAHSLGYLAYKSWAQNLERFVRVEYACLNCPNRPFHLMWHYDQFYSACRRLDQLPVLQGTWRWIVEGMPRIPLRHRCMAEYYSSDHITPLQTPSYHSRP